MSAVGFAAEGMVVHRPSALKRQPWNGHDTRAVVLALALGQAGAAMAAGVAEAYGLADLVTESTNSRPSIFTFTGWSVTFSLHSAMYQTLVINMT